MAEQQLFNFGGIVGDADLKKKKRSTKCHNKNKKRDNSIITITSNIYTRPLELKLKDVTTLGGLSKQMLLNWPKLWKAARKYNCPIKVSFNGEDAVRLEKWEAEICPDAKVVIEFVHFQKKNGKVYFGGIPSRLELFRSYI